MELKPGYKQTEVGVIPKDWEVNSLRRFWSVIDCKHVTAAFVDDGVPLASIREVQSKYVDLANSNKTTSDYYFHLIEGGRKPLPGDLIFSRNATVGEVAQVANWHSAFAMGQDVCLLRKISPTLSSDYLQAIIRSPIVVDQLSNLMVGSTFKRVNIEQIRNLIVSMPPSEEQRAIATALSDVDALLTRLDALIAKKRDIKQAAMQQLLTGKQRLPGFSGEWEVKQLGALFQFLNTANNPRSDLSEYGDIGYIHYGDIHTNPLLFWDCATRRTPRIEPDKVMNIPLLQDGDLVMADASEDYQGIGKSVEIVNVGQRHIVAGLHTFLMRGNKGLLADGFKGYLQHIPAVQAALVRFATGISVYGISKNNVKSIEVLLPGTGEQAAIAAVLSDMDAELAALETRRDKTRALKQGMMQELLTGRIRLL